MGLWGGKWGAACIETGSVSSSFVGRGSGRGGAGTQLRRAASRRGAKGCCQDSGGWRLPLGGPHPGVGYKGRQCIHAAQNCPECRYLETPENHEGSGM